MYQEGEVVISECKTCGENFPVFVFVGDIDMLTTDCVALTSKEKEIVLTERASSETNEQIETRIGPNYNIVGVRYIQPELPPAGTSFQAFRQAYRPPTPVHTCIYCGSDSTPVAHQNKEQFLTHGRIRVENGS